MARDLLIQKVTGGWMRSILFIVIITLFESGFAQPVEYLTPEETHDFLIRYFPLGRNSEDFFQWLRTDEVARERYNQILQTHPRLRRFAEQGNRYRSFYESAFETDFPTGSSHRPWAFNPFDHLVNTFEVFLRTHRSPQEAPMRLLTARNLALQSTINRYQLPSHTTESDIRTHHPLALNYYERQVFRFEQQDELRSANNPRPLNEVFRAWKQRTIEEIDAARAHNLRRAVERVIEIQGGPVYLAEVIRIGLFNTPWYSAAVGEINAGTIYQVDIHFNSAAEETIEKLPEVHVHRTHPRRIPSIRSFFRQAGRNFLEWLAFSSYPLLKGSAEVEKYNEISRRAAGIYSEDLIPMTVTIRFPDQEFTVPLSPLLNALLQQSQALTATSAFEREANRRYLFEAFSRETALRQAREFLEMAPNESVEGFRARLNRWSRHEAGAPIHDVRDLTFRLRTQGFDSRNDLITGIEWYGFLASPFYWQTRDVVSASSSQSVDFHDIPGTVRPSRSSTERTSRAVEDFLMRAPQSIRTNLALAGLLTVFFGSVYGFVHGVNMISGNDWEEISTEDSNNDGNENEGSSSQSAETRKLSMPSYDRATNEAGLGSEQPIHFELTFQNIEHSERPVYFDLATTQLIDRYESEIISVPSYPNADWTVKLESSREIRIVPNQEGLFSLPVPENTDLHAIGIYDFSNNQSLSEGEDFAVHEVQQNGLIFVHILNSHDGAEYKVEAYFTPDPEERNKTSVNPNDRFTNLNLNRLEELNGRLREAGFLVLADEMEKKIKITRESGSSLGLSDIANVFRDSSIYSSHTERMLPLNSKNEFSPYTRFVRNGIVCAECDGMNEFFKVFLEEYFKDQPDVVVENRVNYFNQTRGEKLTAPLHLRTVVRTKDGSVEISLDVTPSAEDEELSTSERPHSDESRRRIDIFNERRGSNLVQKGRIDPTVGEKEHHLRITRLEAQHKRLLDNYFIRHLPAVLRQRSDLPHSRLLQLGNLIKGYASAEISLDHLKIKLRELFPSIEADDINHPLDLQAALKEIAQKESQRLDRVARSVQNGESRIYREYVQPSVVNQIKEYYQLLTEVPWYPVTPGAANSLPCRVILKAVAIPGS